MGLLESAIGGVLGQVFGGQKQGAGGMSPLVKALLMLLLAIAAARAAGGGPRQNTPQRAGSVLDDGLRGPPLHGAARTDRRREA